MKYKIQTQYRSVWITMLIVNTVKEAIVELGRLHAAGYEKYQARFISEDHSPIGGILDCWA